MHAITRLALGLALLLAVALPTQAAEATQASTPFAPRAMQRTTRDGVRIEIGRLDGVPYRIDLPQDWNHRLVVFYHGYALDPVQYALDAPQEWLAPMLARGDAVIQSAYANSGWALQSAMADTAQLRAYFIARYGVPTQSLVAGDSMGGALTALTIESDPGNYQGALALCGALAPSWELTQRQFNFVAAFAYYFPGILPTLDPVPADYAPTPELEQRIAAAVAAHPRRMANLHALWGVGTAQDLPSVIAIIPALIQRDQQQAGGNPFGNANFVYTGTANDAALNAGVRRYAADPAAVAYLMRYYTPSGACCGPCWSCTIWAIRWCPPTACSPTPSACSAPATPATS